MARKRRAITLQEKLEVIEMIEKGIKKCQVSRDLGFAYKTVVTIWSDREKLKADRDSGDRNAKRLRQYFKRGLDRELFSWFQQQKRQNLPANGPMLQSKATELGRKLGLENFKCSGGWIDRFKKRHSISFRKDCANNENVNPDNITEESIEKWSKLERKEDGIPNANEGELLFDFAQRKASQLKKKEYVKDQENSNLLETENINLQEDNDSNSYDEVHFNLKSEPTLFLQEDPLLVANETTSPPFKKKLRIDSVTSEASQKSLNETPSKTSNKIEDVFDAIGKNVAHKLRGMTGQQRIIAEKIISDVMYHGQMETLTPDSHLSLNKSVPVS